MFKVIAGLLEVPCTLNRSASWLLVGDWALEMRCFSFCMRLLQALGLAGFLVYWSFSLCWCHWLSLLSSGERSFVRAFS